MEKQQLENYVRLAKKTDQEAVDELVRYLYPPARQAAKYILTGYYQQDWEDVVNNSFVKMLIKLHTYQENTHFERWFLTIVKNEAINHINKQHKRHLRDIELVINALADAYGDPGEQYKQIELKEIVTEFLEKLPEQQRTAVKLRHFEDMSVKAVAKKMGISESAVKTHVNRGYERIEALAHERGGKQEVFYSVAVVPLLASMLHKDIAAGVFTVPQNLLQAAMGGAAASGATAGTGAASGTGTATATATGTATATATAAPEAAAVLAYTEVATTTAATTGTAAATAATTGGGIVGKFAALGVAAKTAIVGTAAAVTVAGVAVPVYLHNENEKAYRRRWFCSRSRSGSRRKPGRSSLRRNRRRKKKRPGWRRSGRRPSGWPQRKKRPGRRPKQPRRSA